MWFPDCQTHSMVKTRKPGTGNKQTPSKAENMCGKQTQLLENW